MSLSLRNGLRQGVRVVFARLAMVRVEEMQITPAGVVFTVACRQPSACCPSCQTPSSRVYSTYVRTPDDLPMRRPFTWPTLSAGKG